MVVIWEDNSTHSRSKNLDFLCKGCRTCIWCASSLFSYWVVLRSYLVDDQMWEVINTCMLMHNMIIESECVALVINDYSYDRLSPLFQVEVEFIIFLTGKLWWSWSSPTSRKYTVICGCSKKISPESWSSWTSKSFQFIWINLFPFSIIVN
jgi:hypothetical protein